MSCKIYRTYIWKYLTNEFSLITLIVFIQIEMLNMVYVNLNKNLHLIVFWIIQNKKVYNLEFERIIIFLFKHISNMEIYSLATTI